MNNVFFLSFLSLFGLSACTQKIDFQANDRIIMIEDNNSIKDYQSHTFCETTFGQIKSKAVAQLMNKLNGKEIEISDGGTYIRLTVYEGNTQKEKFSQRIDWGTHNESAAQLLELLVKDCGK